MAANSALKLLLGSVHKNWNVAMEVVAASSSPYHNFHEATTTITTVHAFVSTTSKLVSSPPCRQQQQQRSFSSNKLSLIAFSSLSELGRVKKKATEPRVLHSCSSRFSSSVFGRKQQSWKFQLCEERKLLGSVTRFNNVRLLASFNVPPVFGEEEKSGLEDKDSPVKLLGNQSLKEEEEQQQLLLEERPLGSSGADPYLWEDQFLKDSAKTRQPKPMCYYFTQGLCTLMEDAQHMAKFSHLYPDLPVRAMDVHRLKKQPFDYYLVLDLEGMVEILEFPIIMIDARTLKVVDRFHRFVRPVKMTEARQAEYVSGKYGRWGLDRVWHDTAIPFTEVLKAFEEWLERQELWEPYSVTKLKDAAFVTCGNWDVKTKIPEQCETSGIDLPPYFNEWINLKDIYLNFYKQRVCLLPPAFFLHNHSSCSSRRDVGNA
ncbi:hypothetical protein CY35_18G065800 [Sphagnum magellanicum]|nr:hypothetical protein CY35_18G065800 [Sphagnum magellanicum]